MTTRLMATAGISAREEPSGAVRDSTERIGLGDVPIHRCLCFTDADWSLFARPFEIGGVWVGWGKALVENIHSESVLVACALNTLSHHLSNWLPASK